MWPKESSQVPKCPTPTADISCGASESENGSWDLSGPSAHYVKRIPYSICAIRRLIHACTTSLGGSVSSFPSAQSWHKKGKQPKAAATHRDISTLWLCSSWLNRRPKCGMLTKSNTATVKSDSSGLAATSPPWQKGTISCLQGTIGNPLYPALQS